MRKKILIMMALVMLISALIANSAMATSEFCYRGSSYTSNTGCSYCASPKTKHYRTAYVGENLIIGPWHDEYTLHTTAGCQFYPIVQHCHRPVWNG